MGSLRLTTTGATSLCLALRGGRQCRLQRKQWTTIDRADDAFWLLAPRPQNIIVRADRELAPYYVTSATGKSERVRLRFDWKTREFVVEPGQWLEVDRVAFLYLTRRSQVRAVRAHEVLTKKPGARVLLQRGGGVGDLMFLTAGVRALLREHPGAELHLATAPQHRQLMADTGLFAGVYDVFGAYDTAPFDFDADLRLWVEAHPRQHEINRMEQFAEGLGVSCIDDYQMVCGVRDVECPVLDGVERPLSVDLSGSGWQRGPSFDHAAAIVRGVADVGWTPINIRVRPVPWWPSGVGIESVGGDPALQLPILSRSVVLSVDTGTLHLANALGRPSVGLFGPVPARLRVAGQPQCTVIESPSPCRDCYSHRRKCTANTRAKCFDDISVASIVEALRTKG